MILAAKEGQEKNVRNLLVNPRIDVNALDSQGKTCLHYAAKKVFAGNKNVVQWLIENGTDIENNYETTPLGGLIPPLMLASIKGYEKISKIHLDYGAEINNTIVVNASIRKIMNEIQVLVVDLFNISLINLGLSMDNETTYNLPIHLDRTSSIHFDAYAGHLNVTKRLLENDANINDKVHGGRKALKDREEFFYFKPFGTALHLAACEGHENIVVLLINYGADVNSKNDIGETTLTMAIQKGHYNIVNLLIENDVDIESKTLYYETPLMGIDLSMVIKRYLIFSARL
ncbi:uncharacterized protein LOC116344921 [Contarinia nasturtii]|uniref:uncharacterized protein LOC116344921 n=1 Tax=Contarinia nasturtii TaxID=265458 RepID=UPI0012D4A56E|nr:uncharacterized protein LOC116344921 [Contarinia nasturtii]